MDIRSGKNLLLLYMKANVPSFLWGTMGIGKSDIVRYIGAQMDLPVIDFRAILRDPIDLRGIPDIDRENKVAQWLPPSDLPNELRHGPAGIFFMDELNAAPPSVQAACYGLVLDRKVGEYQLPEGWKIIAAGNRQSDKGVVNRMPAPLANRFAHIDIEPDVDSFVSFGLETGRIHPLALGYVRWKGKDALHNVKYEDLRAFQTPRSWERFSEVLAMLDLRNDLGGEDADGNMQVGMIMRAGTGIVGESAAGEFVGFLRTYNDLPRFDDIVKRPNDTKIPTEPSGQFALCTNLAARIEPEHMEPAMTYVGRISPEWLTMFVFDVIGRDNGRADGKKFQNTRAYIKWGGENMPKMTNVRA